MLNESHIRKLSRWMPAAPVQEDLAWGWVALMVLLVMVFGIFAFLVFFAPGLFAFLPVLIWICWSYRAKQNRRMRAWLSRRAGRDIGTFAREFDYRRTDTWVLRAVYEEFSRCLLVDGQPFPIRPGDRLVEDLQLDPEDTEEEILLVIGHRAGRFWGDLEKNPLFGKVNTVRDLVHFLEHQPRLQSVEASGTKNGY